MLLLPSSFHSFIHTCIHSLVHFLELHREWEKHRSQDPDTPVLPFLAKNSKANCFASIPLSLLMTPTAYWEVPLRICVDALGSVRMRKGLHRPQPASTQAHPWHSGHQKPDEVPQCLHSKVLWLHRVRHTTAASTGGQRRKDLCENIGMYGEQFHLTG